MPPPFLLVKEKTRSMAQTVGSIHFRLEEHFLVIASGVQSRMEARSASTRLVATIEFDQRTAVLEIALK